MFTLRRKMFSMHNTMRIEKPDDVDAAESLDMSEATFREKLWGIGGRKYYLFRGADKVCKITGNP
jgi:hypothetical protein